MPEPSRRGRARVRRGRGTADEAETERTPRSSSARGPPRQSSRPRWALGPDWRAAGRGTRRARPWPPRRPRSRRTTHPSRWSARDGGRRWPPEQEPAEAPVRLQIRRPLSAAPRGVRPRGGVRGRAGGLRGLHDLRSAPLELAERRRVRAGAVVRPTRWTAAGTRRSAPTAPTPKTPPARVCRYAVRAAACCPVASRRSPRRSSATPRPSATASPRTRQACPVAVRPRRQNPSPTTTRTRRQDRHDREPPGRDDRRRDRDPRARLGGEPLRRQCPRARPTPSSCPRTAC